jgi:hypothetical protein
MAKAIYGHTGADARLAAEVARLRDWQVPADLLVPDPR